jgi:hypothetical protein
MTRKELLESDGYWEALLDLTLTDYRYRKRKKKDVIKEIIERKNELIKLLKK